MTRAAADPAPADKAASEAPELDVKVLGESKYDQITSMLMAVLLGAILVVGWLGLVYVSTQAYASRVSAPLQIIEVFGGGGGSPDGTAGSTEKRGLLSALGVQHVMDSRTLAFADEVLKLTNGEGIDIVLNSLSGEAIPVSALHTPTP